MDSRVALGAATTIEEVVGADRDYRQQLASESDRFAEALRRERDSEGRLEQEVHGLTSELRELKDRDRSLRAEVDNAKAQLQAARQAHRGTDLQDLTAAADRGQVAEELDWLRRKAEDDEKTLAFLTNTSQQLQRHNEDLKAQVGRLERERKIIAGEVQQEREAAKQEERQVAELRNRVEKLRRQTVAQNYHKQEEDAREQKMREIKQGAVMSSAAARPGHSWAHSISTPGAQTQPRAPTGPKPPPNVATAPQGAQQRSPGRPAGMPVGPLPPGADVHV